MTDSDAGEEATGSHARLRGAMADIRRGRYYGYPVCCIAHYCLDTMLGRPPALTRAWQLSETEPSDATQVVCGFLHRGGSTLGLTARVRRIVAFNVNDLRPPRAERESLAQAILPASGMRDREWECYAKGEREVCSRYPPTASYDELFSE